MAKDEDKCEIPHTRAEPRPDFSKNPSKPLPAGLQKAVDQEESIYERLWDGSAPESTDSNVRYAAYASRIRTILISAQRYIAYTSDIGESFRPIAHPYLVKGAYGVSWAYLAGDVGNEAWKAYVKNQAVRNPQLVQQVGEEVHGKDGNEAKNAIAKSAAKDSIQAKPVRSTELQRPAPSIQLLDDYRVVAVQRALFQSIASMGLPAFTIHNIVRYSGRWLKDAKNQRIRVYGPIGLGLAAVPALPFLFDKPVEEVVEWTFHKALGGRMIGGGPPAKEKEL